MSSPCSTNGTHVTATTDYSEIARLACAQLGADGLLVVRMPPGFDGEMRVFNADGSEAEMCGNGIRCVVRFIAERDRKRTGGDPHPARGRSHGDYLARSVLVRTEIGNVHVSRSAPSANRSVRTGSALNSPPIWVGNPHAVVFMREIARSRYGALAHLFAGDERFPYGVNVHAAVVVDERTLRVRH